MMILVGDMHSAGMVQKTQMKKFGISDVQPL
jgi:hypothetical protein